LIQFRQSLQNRGAAVEKVADYSFVPPLGSIVKDGYVCKSLKGRMRIVGRGERI